MTSPLPKQISTTPLTTHYALMRAVWVLGFLLSACVLSILWATSYGSVPLTWAEVGRVFLDWTTDFTARSFEPTTLAQSLVALRLERALVAWVTGAALALAGVLMQALLRNPLADPYILGVSSGAAVGALIVLLTGATLWSVDLGSIAGAGIVSLLLATLAWREWRGQSAVQSAPVLLLTGVVLSSACAAVIGLILSVAPDSRLRGMVFWLMGDLSGAPLRGLPWLILVTTLCIALWQARRINLLAMFAERATTYGVAVGRMRFTLFGCAALLTASAVTTGGSIGFIGLIVPHACRFALGPDHRLLIPSAALVGGCFLVVTDTLARSLLAPLQLPVGAMTALIGVPIFLLQLYTLRRGVAR